MEHSRGTSPVGDGIQKKYAIIINGDTEDRHLKNVDRAIKAIKAEDPSYEVLVASPNKPKFGVTRYEKGDVKGLRSIISGLAAKADDDDIVVIYVTGHGEKGNHGEGCAELQSGCYSMEGLKRELAKIKYGNRIVVMDQCYSGRALPLFANSRTEVVTLGSPNEKVCCQQSAPHFWSDKVPDLDGDGIISIVERHLYVKQAGQPTTLPQHFKPDLSLSLSGKRDKSPSFKPKLVRVHSDAELQAQLEKLKKKRNKGELALVMFSADWCDACKKYLPTFEKLAKTYGGKFLMIYAEGKRGAEEKWAEQYGFEGVPAFALIGRMPHNGGFKAVKVKNPANLMSGLIEMSIISPEDELRYHIPRLSHPDPRVRRNSAETIGELREKAASAVPALIKLLEGSDVQCAIAAAEALGKIGERAASALPALIRALDHRKEDVRAAAIFALPNIGEKAVSSIPILVKKIATDPFNQIRINETLINFRKLAAPAVPDVIKLTYDTNPAVKRAAIEALGIFGGLASSAKNRLIELLKSPENKIRDAAQVALAHIAINNEEVFKDVLKLLESVDSDERAGYAAILGIIYGRYNYMKDLSSVTKSIIALSKDNVSKVKISALRALGTIADSYSIVRDDVIKCLSHALSENDPAVRTAAVTALQIRGMPASSILPLLNKHINDSSAEVRTACVETLGYLGNKPNRKYLLQILQKLIKASHDDKAMVRAAVANELKDVLFWTLESEKITEGSIIEQAKRTLLILMNDPVNEVRLNAIRPAYLNIYCLATESEEMIKTYISLTKDGDLEVEEAAIQSLIKILEASYDEDFMSVYAQYRTQIALILADKLDDDNLRGKVWNCLKGIAEKDTSIAKIILPRALELVDNRDEFIRVRAREFVEKYGRKPSGWHLSAGPIIGNYNEQFGIGGSLGAEYRFNTHWALESRFSASWLPGSEYAHLGASITSLYYLSGETFNPYLSLPSAGFSYYAGKDEGYAALRINPIGIGMKLFLGDSFFIDGSLRTRVDITFDEDSTSKFGVDVPLLLGLKL